MSQNGGNGHIRVEEHFDFDSTMLTEAIFHYLAQRGIKYGPGVEFEWSVEQRDGRSVPHEEIKDISVRCHLGNPNQTDEKAERFELMRRMEAQKKAGTLPPEQEATLEKMLKDFRDSALKELGVDNPEPDS